MAKFKVLRTRGWDLIPSSHNFVNPEPEKAGRSERRIKWMR
jgi:hypothetical protein